MKDTRDLSRDVIKVCPLVIEVVLDAGNQKLKLIENKLQAKPLWEGSLQKHKTNTETDNEVRPSLMYPYSGGWSG